MLPSVKALRRFHTNAPLLLHRLCCAVLWHYFDGCAITVLLLSHYCAATKRLQWSCYCCVVSGYHSHCLPFSVPHLCSLILESGLNLLPAFANQLRHNLLIIIPQREVGGDAAVVSSQKPDGSSVICPSCIVLCVIIPHRHTGFAQGSYLRDMHCHWSEKPSP